MATQRDDVDFYSETVSANLSTPSKIGISLLWGLVGLISFIIVLFFITTRHTEVIAEGKVKPSLQVRSIESLEQGIVEEILIRENEHVKKGDVLVRLSFRREENYLAEAISKRYALLARITRLKAILDEEELEFSDDLIKNAPDAVANERRVYKRTLESHRAQTDGSIFQVNMRLAEKDSALAEQEKLRDSYNLALEEANIIRPLVERNAQPKIRLIQREREVARIKTDLDYNTTFIPLTEAAIKQAQAELAGIRGEQKEQIGEELIQSLAELSELNEAIKGYQDTLKRRDIKAPVSGIVQKLYTTSVGNISLAGEPILDLVPDEDSTLITVNINPQDRGQVKECLITDINITAFDIDKYGTIEGWVERISPDSITNERGLVYFEVDIRSDETSIKSKDGTNEPISVGLEAKAFIKTGERKIIGYVLKPLAKNFKSWNNANGEQKYRLYDEKCLEENTSIAGELEVIDGENIEINIAPQEG